MRGVARATVWAALLLVLSASSASAAWQPGDEVVEGWVLSEQERHREFVRLTLKGSAGETARAEITFARGAEDVWSTRLYRIQPAPGGKLPAALAVALKQRLAQLEQEPGHVPWVGDAKAAAAEGSDAVSPHASGYSVPYPPPWRWPLLGLLGLLVLLGGACLGSLQPDRRREALVGAGAALGLGVAVRLGLPVDALPTEWITVLHEGSVERIVATLYGNGNHGPLHDTVRWALAPEAVLGLRAAVTLQIALGAANTVGFLVLARGVLRHWPLALLMTACFALNPLRVNGLLSELPSELLTSLTLIGCAGIAALRTRRWLGVLTLAAVTVAAAATRPEVAAVGALATATALVPRWPRSVAIIAAVAGLSMWAAMPLVSPFHLEGAGLEVLTLPIELAVALPIGAIVLALAGIARSVTAPATFTLAAVGLLPLFRVYWAAAHHGEAPWEVLRYMTLLTPIVMVTALLGWRPLVSGVPERWRRVLVVALAAACALPPPDAIARAVMPEAHQGSPDRLVSMPLARLQQAEARSLAAVLEADPSCLVVTTSARDPKQHVPIEAWDWVFYGAGLVQPLTLPRDPPALGAAVDAVAPGAGCVRFHRGIDCHVIGGPRCAEEVSGRRPSSWQTWQDRPYYDHLERQTEVQLEVYGLRP